ncbi:sensor histidine kinase KdpD [Clostridium manihotivorum]|uniref:Histidine kinase n=1 Tax=Clostridium manihotivorum TaxID=2320868 RepID=A0A3R5U6P7_9CLOT|nr:sensor histidine kinase KdpD [Clostridium manihotivorum]QAA33295.1 histidine kinase [Clostridium manihotivorum]
MCSKFIRTSPELALKIAEGSYRGKLKIFLGYAPGVGKTYSMLNEAKRRIKYGQNVVIGYLETQNRADTEKNKEGIEQVPLKEIKYKGKIFYEPDVDRIIQLKPEVVLIDELAHSNPPSSKNKKRYQDVLEILSAGINVITTLNVQHIESLNFLTTNITRVDVSELVPYEVIDKADEVIVVDLPPEELIKRFREGKVFKEYYNSRIENYYNKNTLNALRSICLKAVAEEVDTDLYNYMKQKNINLNWHVAERIMVIIDSEAASRKLVVRGEKMAERFNSEIFVIYIRETNLFNLGSSKLSQLELRLKTISERVGAKFLVVESKSYIKSLCKYISENYITFVIIGNNISFKKRFRSYFRMKMLTRLIKNTEGVEFHIIPN